jgi:hypothetical protein
MRAGLTYHDSALVAADDALQLYTHDTVIDLLYGRRNPNSCPVGMTYFVSLNYTDFHLVTDVRGSHLMTPFGILNLLHMCSSIPTILMRLRIIRFLFYSTSVYIVEQQAEAAPASLCR